jgi:hypothetical protein
MNPAEVKRDNLIILRRAADRMARALCEGVRSDRPKKQLLTIVTEQIGSLRVRCPACAADVPAMLLGRDDAHHVCVVARRSSFMSLRRRLEEYFRRARLKCSSCEVMTQDFAAEEGPDVADEGPREGGGASVGVACAASEG